MNPTIDELLEALEVSWCEETSQCGEGVWTEDNPARGQCAVTSVVIHDYFGGRLKRAIVSSEGFDSDCVHYWNELPNGMWFDATQSQFEDTYAIEEIMNRTPEYVLSNTDSLERYKLLKSRVVTYLATKQYEREQMIRNYMEANGELSRS